MGENKFTTRYVNNHQSSASAADENQLTFVGLASDGPTGQILSCEGMSGVESCDAAFGTTGRLPRAVREAIEAVTNAAEGNPIRVNAMRLGDGTKAAINLYDNSSTVIVMAIEYDYNGVDGNEWQAKVEVDDEEAVITLRRTATGTATQFSADITGGDPTPCDTLVDAINNSSLPLTAKMVGECATLDEIAYTAFSGGTDGTLTNEQALAALSFLESKNYPNIYILGWKGSGIAGAYVRQALGTHCAAQLSERDCERFAFVEMEDFGSSNPAPFAAWEADIATWVESIEAASLGEDDRNLIPLAGSAQFADADGDSYTAPIGPAAAGLFVAQPIDRGMINLQVKTVTEDQLAPNIPAAYRSRLADARMNYLRYEDDKRGVIIANSETLAVSTSDFTDAEVLRTVYTCGQESRIAGKPVWGRPDDGSGSGLNLLKDAMESTLLKTRVGKTITKVVVTPTIDDDGEVVADMAITTHTTMKTISHRVYRQRS